MAAPERNRSSKRRMLFPFVLRGIDGVQPVKQFPAYCRWSKTPFKAVAARVVVKHSATGRPERRPLIPCARRMAGCIALMPDERLRHDEIALSSASTYPLAPRRELIYDQPSFGSASCGATLIRPRLRASTFSPREKGGAGRPTCVNAWPAMGRLGFMFVDWLFASFHHLAVFSLAAILSAEIFLTAGRDRRSDGAEAGARRRLVRDHGGDRARGRFAEGLPRRQGRRLLSREHRFSGSRWRCSPRSA